MDVVINCFQFVSASVRSKWRNMGFVKSPFNLQLSEFQKRKLLHEFHMFFDSNKDGVLEVQDVYLARNKICEMSGWKPGTDTFKKTNERFVHIWRGLLDDGDTNNDRRISEDEWLKMWKVFNKKSMQLATMENSDGSKSIPDWLEKYIEYKFDLLDRTGDGEIDAEEYEYVMSEFGVPPKDARNAFLIFSQNNEKKVDMDYFRELCVQFYRSDDPCALGNFINGLFTYKN